MIPCVFRLTQPVEWRGRIYVTGQEANLRLRGWPTSKFREALMDGILEHPIPRIDFYFGPYHQRFWDLDLFTDHDVYFAVKRNRILHAVDHPTTKSRVLKYLAKHKKGWMVDTPRGTFGA